MSKIRIGKFTLESLTTGMYNNPYIIFREYIQNSADSIDEAIRKNLILEDNATIKVKLLRKDKKIIIEDNGVGINSEKAYSQITNIGNSNKRYGSHKGFRGIGRLAGLSYCNKLIFETTAKSEEIKTIITFNCEKLRQLLIPGKYDDLDMYDVLGEVVEVKYEKEVQERHYFRVVLSDVNEKHSLLDYDRVYDYLVQTAPVSFNKIKFTFAKMIYSKFKEMNIERNEYNIFLSDGLIEQQIFKAYKNNFISDLSKKLEDDIKDIEFIRIRDDYRDKDIALVWIANSDLKGTIVDNSVKGLRMRKGNILIGDRSTANDLYKEERFNGWIQGEVIVLDEGIIPNARRDNFEQNEEYLYLIDKLKEITDKISYDIREKSKERNKQLKDNNRRNNEVESIQIKSNIINNNTEILEKLDKMVEKIHQDRLEEKKILKTNKFDALVEILSKYLNDKEIKRKILDDFKEAFIS